MNVKFDFIVHWLWTIVFALLSFSGVTMIGARYGWILNYDIYNADLIHRVLAAMYVVLFFISIVYEAMSYIKNKDKKREWLIIGRRGYQLFTFITSLIFIITGAVIWVCMNSNMAAAAFALVIHEKLTYIAIASVIWHVYKKSHTLLLPTSKNTLKDTKNHSSKG